MVFHPTTAELLNVETEPRRVVVENVSPEIDGGRFFAKRVVGNCIHVEADIFADGHDQLSAALLYRGPNDDAWNETSMKPLVNDRWEGSFLAGDTGFHRFTVEGWIDHFLSWQHGLRKKVAAGTDVAIDLEIGLALIDEAARAAGGADSERLLRFAQEIRSGKGTNVSAQIERALDRDLADLMRRYADRGKATRHAKELVVLVEPKSAVFSSWYELFPRSFSPDPGKHGTLRDCERLLPRVAKMGFDILYLPPIHPIGKQFRKGKNNSTVCKPGDPGSPWGIGSDEGGHTAIHPELGTFDDFAHLLQAAREHGLRIALDIAFQCAPDHPWVKDHPEWFVHRPDGTIQYAENPPKKYQDIYPLNFESKDWKELWRELKRVFDFWIEKGVEVFRVDNPHTKALPFWEWLIGEIKRDRPGVIFLSEAFTRPKVMYYLAKAGFTQSYNYFPWRNQKWELTQFMEEVTRPPVSDFFRPNLWPNTPDILPQYLQYGGRPAFVARLILAATLGASYGIYGPAFELCDNVAREPGAEEYLNSEKYEIKQWDLEAEGNLADLIARVNRIRRDNPALHTNGTLHFHPTDNEQIIAYSKHDAKAENLILTAVNLDPHHTQGGWMTIEAEKIGLPLEENFQAHDLLTGARYLWHGARNYVEINPHFVPAQIFRIRRRVRTEHDFDYFM